MKRNPLYLAILALVLVPVLPIPLPASAEAAQEKASSAPEQVDMAAMMARARQFTQPGENHKLLERFLGDWETEMRITMPGTGMPPEKGTAKISWLMEGYWIQSHGEGTFMGRPVQSFMVLGYDNFKQSYRMMTVGTTDTAMLVSEGDMDPGGKALLTYGTLDEYLTGEHDKMVKYVWRFPSDDEMVLEIHDLPIGEKNTKVVEMHYRRVKDGGKS
jgi:hypothetical protein